LRLVVYLWNSHRNSTALETGGVPVELPQELHCS